MLPLDTLPPQEHVYESFVPPRYHGYPIEKYFGSRFSYHSEQEWADRILAGRITVNGQMVPPGTLLRDRDKVVTRVGLKVEPPANRRLQVLFENAFLRVFNKAAPIPVHPSGRYYKNSMTELLKDVYPDEVPRPVQRLDLWTTGVLVFARTKAAASFLMNEFQANRIEKEYWAIVEGVPEKETFIVETPIGRVQGSKRGTGPGLTGSKTARTEFQWMQTLNGRSLLRVIPRSGRTNQIRVHLSSIGLPIVNDPVYGKGKEPDAGLGLHALRLRFKCFDMELEFTAACPDHFKPFLAAVY